MSIVYIGFLLVVVSFFVFFFYSELWFNEVKDGILNVYFFGYLYLYNVLVIDFLGLFLEEFFDGCGCMFMFKIVVMIVI